MDFDIAWNIVPLLDNATLKKVYICGLLPCLPTLIKSDLFWRARIETLIRRRISFWNECENEDPKIAYQILIREGKSNKKSPWNEEDCLLATLILVYIGYQFDNDSIYRACKYGSMNILHYLFLDKKTNTCVRRWEDYPITIATVHGRVEAVRFFLDIHRANCSPCVPEECVIGSLITHGLLRIAAVVKHKERVSDYVEIMKLLLEAGSLPTQQVLGKAIRHSSDPSTAKLLLSYPNTFFHQDILILAAGMGREEIVKLLLQDASGDVKSKALIHACASKRKEIIDLLLAQQDVIPSPICFYKLFLGSASHFVLKTALTLLRHDGMDRETKKKVIRNSGRYAALLLREAQNQEDEQMIELLTSV